MFKVVVNTCYGGFGLSDEALAEYNKRAGTDYECDWDIARDDKHLVAIGEELGDKANGLCAKLGILEIPAGVAGRWHIDEYDGLEHVAEDHRTWYGVTKD